MNERGQAGFGESSASGDPAGGGSARDADASGDVVARVEAALGALRGGPPPGFGRGRPRGFGPGSPGPGIGQGFRPGSARADAARPAEEHQHHGEHAHPGPHGDHGDHGPHRGPGGRGGHAAVRLLLALSHHGPMSVNEIADHVGVDQPRASRLVRAAVEAGHIRREPDPNDARRSILVITEGGRAALAALMGRRRGAVERALADFSDAEREQFAALFTRFAEAWRRG
ncbi:MarR family winged helix-turn-helix transcriptional regulator [Agromyces soli]